MFCFELRTYSCQCQLLLQRPVPLHTYRRPNRYRRDCAAPAVNSVLFSSISWSLDPIVTLRNQQRQATACYATATLGGGCRRQDGGNAAGFAAVLTLS